VGRNGETSHQGQDDRPAQIRYEYKVVPAPKRAKVIKGVRSHEDQFAAVLAEAMNDLAADHWEYFRAESLPCEEKAGLTKRIETYQTVLVFRRPFAADQTFFLSAPPKQIEYHHPDQDISEQQVVFASGRRSAAASARQTAPAPEPTSRSGVLAMLQKRRARQLLDEPADYDGLWKHAAE